MELRVVPNVQPAGTVASPQYNKLDHLAFTVTGADATRSELDSMEESMYDGESWRSLADDVYNGQSAANSGSRRSTGISCTATPPRTSCPR